MKELRNPAANINIHIERIVLDSGAFTSAQIGLMQSSMERELTTLLRAGGLPVRNRTEGKIVGATRGQLPRSSIGATAQNPSQLGRALARSVYDSLDTSGHSSGEFSQ